MDKQELIDTLADAWTLIRGRVVNFEPLPAEIDPLDVLDRLNAAEDAVRDGWIRDVRGEGELDG